MSEFKVSKRATRSWPGGVVQFSVICRDEHPEQNYIIMEKVLPGRSGKSANQMFIMRLHDWSNLKKLIDGADEEALGKTAKWPASTSQFSQQQLNELAANSDAIEKILQSPKITELTDASFEALNKIGDRIYELKHERIDQILKSIANSSSDSIDQVGTLLNAISLEQMSTLASLIYQKIKVLDLLERLTTDKTVNERAVHKLMEANPWLLGKSYEILSSDNSLKTFLDENAPKDAITKKRPDLIVKSIPNTNDLVIVELKAPGVKLSAENIGQVLTYKAVIEKNKPNVGKIDCYLYGYEKGLNFTQSKDATIMTFSELIAQRRAEYNEYLKITEAETDQERLDDMTK